MKVVLSGSGIQYPMHAGALQALVEEGYSIDKIIGVSGGAIVGGAVASGYEPGEKLNNLILDTLPGPNDLLDPHWLPFWNWGLYKGDAILERFQYFMEGSFRNTSIPFHAVTVNIDSEEVYSIFGPGHRMDATVPKAVRASMTYPFVFEPVKIDGDRHIDGGVAANFPVDFYGKGKDVVGFHVTGGFGGVDAPKGWAGLLDYGKYLMGTMLRASNREHIEDAMHARVVELSAPNVGVLDLNIGRKKARRMIKIGYYTAKKEFS